jgi:hypothetical protein
MRQLNFGGHIISDWGATYNGTAAALAGLDIVQGIRKSLGFIAWKLEYPADPFVTAPSYQVFGPQLRDAVQNGTVPMEILDDKVVRCVRLLPLRETSLIRRGDYLLRTLLWAKTTPHIPLSISRVTRVRRRLQPLSEESPNPLSRCSKTSEAKMQALACP